jgi:hypothetical protein
MSSNGLRASCLRTIEQFCCLLYSSARLAWEIWDMSTSIISSLSLPEALLLPGPQLLLGDMKVDTLPDEMRASTFFSV